MTDGSPKHYPGSMPTAIADLLTTSPPGSHAEFEITLNERGFWPLPEITLRCETCAGDRRFASTTHLSSSWFVTQSARKSTTLECRCKNCSSYIKVFGITIEHDDPFFGMRGGSLSAKVTKFGEHPRWGERIPTRIRRMTGENFELFEKGYRCESQGLGVGAFAYYRGVVEMSWKKILGEVRRAASKHPNTEDFVSDIDASIKQRQFKKSVDSMKHAIPENLSINGQNPLILLHNATSVGLHGRSDEQCLGAAAAVRTLLVRTITIVEELLEDTSATDEAVKLLMSLKSGGDSD